MLRYFIIGLIFMAACTQQPSQTKEETSEQTQEQVDTTQATQQEADTTQVSEGKVAYVCPMKCEGEKHYHQPGKCPVCGMELEKITLAEK